MRVLFFHLTLCMFVFASCNHNQPETSSRFTLAALDINAPDSSFKYLQKANTSFIDSGYNYILAALIDSNDFDLADKHLHFYEQLKGDRKIARALILKVKGWRADYRGNYDSSNQYFLNAIAIYTDLKRPTDIGESYYGMGVNYMFLGNYAEMFRYHVKALGIFEQLKDSINIFKTRTEIANGHFFLNQPAKAIAILDSNLVFYQRRHLLASTAYNQSILSKVYYRQNNYAKGLEYAEAALKIRRSINDTVGISGSLNNMAAACLGLQQWDKALAGFEESLAIVMYLKDKRQEHIVKQNIANCLWHMGKTKEAELMTLKMVDSAKQKKEASIITNAYRLLAKFNKEQQQYKQALYYYECYKAYNDTLLSQQKDKAVNELLIQYETGKKEARIAQLNNENRWQSTQKLLYLAILVCTLLAGTFAILFLRNRNKKNRLQLDKVKLELEGNVRELNRFTDSIIRKNKQIEELEEELRSTQQQAEEASRTEQNKEQLSQLYQLKILTEDDWRNFKILFDKVHPGFINHLRAQIPDLAPAEERQFLLIKLNIDNKESADMLGISAEGVKKNRYRLKKRFQLDDQANLDEFVRNFA